MNKLRCMLFLAFATLFSVNCWAQAHEGQTTFPQPVPITLWMDWTRGDPHYGPDFIRLHRSCDEHAANACECIEDFKVISSKENSKEFADYVTSFAHGKVPVVYSVFYSRPQGRRFLGARLDHVGEWTSDRFEPNDRMLWVKVTFHPSQVGQTQSAPINSPGDCFPPSKP